MKIFLSPHTDDECIFGSFTVQREKPLVIVVFDSFVQVTRGAAYCDWETRREETQQALSVLVEPEPMYDTATGTYFVPNPAVKFCGFRDDAPVPAWMIADTVQQLLADEVPEHIFAPAWEANGHDQHNEVATAASALVARWNDGKPPVLKQTRYLTYTRHNGKSRSGMPVPATPEMIRRKHLALACYKSQIENPMTREWFMKDLEEYYA